MDVGYKEDRAWSNTKPSKIGVCTRLSKTKVEKKRKPVLKYNTKLGNSEMIGRAWVGVRGMGNSFNLIGSLYFLLLEEHNSLWFSNPLILQILRLVCLLCALCYAVDCGTVKRGELHVLYTCNTRELPSHYTQITLSSFPKVIFVGLNVF